MEEILLILCLTLNICFSFKPSDVLTLQEYNAWMHGNVTPEASEIEIYEDTRMTYVSTELMVPEAAPLADIHRRFAMFSYSKLLDISILLCIS